MQVGLERFFVLNVLDLETLDVGRFWTVCIICQRSKFQPRFIKDFVQLTCLDLSTNHIVILSQHT